MNGGSVEKSIKKKALSGVSRKSVPGLPHDEFF